MGSLSMDFLIGVATGLGIAFVTGFIWRIYQNWVRRAGAADKPQMIPQFTKSTPTQVYQDSMRAKIAMFIFWVTAFFIGIMLWAWLDPRVWAFLLNQIELLF